MYGEVSVHGLLTTLYLLGLVREDNIHVRGFVERMVAGERRL